MILALMIVNNYGKPRLLKFFTQMPEMRQQQIVRDLYNELSVRSENACSFFDGSTWFGTGTRIIYRQYATLFFSVAADTNESELGILDLIQVLVESLDQHFKSACELDLVFKTEQVHWLVDEIFVGGMVVETSMQDILDTVHDHGELIRKENDLPTATESLQAAAASIHAASRHPIIENIRTKMLSTFGLSPP